MAALAAALAETVLAAAGGRAEARARDGVAELQIDPSASLALDAPQLRAAAAYEPRLLLRGEDGGLASLLHAARAELEWQPEPSRKLRLRARGSYGDSDFSPLVGLPDQPLPERLPAARSFRTESLDASGEWAEELTRSLRLTTSAGFLVSGGATAEARDSIPLQRGPRAEARLAWAIDARDSLGAALSAQALRTSASRGALVAVLEASGSRRLDRETTVEASAGAGVSQPLDGEAAKGYPVASARVRHRPALRGTALSLSLEARVAPAVDWLGGGAYQRAEAAASASLQPSREVAFSLRASAATALSSLPGGGAGVVAGEASAQVFLAPNAVISAGARVAQLSSAAPGQPERQWLAFVALTARQEAR